MLEKIEALRAAVERRSGGAVGAGLVLIILPCLLLWLGYDRLGNNPMIGLPVMAIFGIMMLFGALALVATLFARLQLQDATQALALPPGSIRAAIALSLIVLFAIISIMLYQSLLPAQAEPFELDGLGEPEIMALATGSSYQVLTKTPASCARRSAVEAPCAVADLRYRVRLKPQAKAEPPPSAAIDIAKQLLILIGTLMTSVTSFYFGSRTSESQAARLTPTAQAAPASPPPPEASVGDGDRGHEHTHGDELADGCNVVATEEDATPDEALPQAEGGVEKS